LSAGKNADGEAGPFGVETSRALTYEPDDEGPRLKKILGMLRLSSSPVSYVKVEK
jgi:hypothetical protein